MVEIDLCQLVTVVPIVATINQEVVDLGRDLVNIRIPSKLI